ncbi:MAG: S1 RNA-binding domain-containing protein [Endomicrobiaceae bacterium]|nr:S1 RNA-binding domain-containing protein [Endomicrobiaceae bacterium]MDD3729639.1 S1 RNA-binding domain-containing protein [Endomicrobiaceae bacterium]MDD4165873.1 S1 RNA-binding domain-containing protein [Endomicrobiaceae bacterium]
MNKENNNLDNLTVFEDAENISMDDLLGPEMKVNRGEIISVKIVSENADGFLVDLGMKSDGIILKSEFAENQIPKELKTGAEVKVFIKRTFPKIELSYREVMEKSAWDKVEENFRNKKNITGTILKTVKGGFIVDIGVNAFLHISQVDSNFVKDGEKYVGKTYEFAITEFNRDDKKISLSRRKLLEDEKLAKKQAALDSLAEGQIIDGAVTRITNFGAFIDLGGIDGLLHIGELAWYKVKKVEDLLKAGQIVRVQIIKLDKENEKISLSMKQLAANPWDVAGEKYLEGLIIKGKVTSVMPFGAFVELEPGVEGLLHSSEYAWNDSENSFKKEVVAGKELEVKIIGSDKVSKKISLSVKKMHTNPWEEAARHYAPGTKVKGIVKNIMPFGAFVKLPEGIEGLIHISNFSWTKGVKHPENIVKKGDEVEVMVLSVNTQNEEIALSLKHLSQDPYKKYKQGTAVKGKVKRVLEFGAFVEIEEGIEALLKKTELSMENSGQELPKEGEEIEATIIKADTKERKLEISIKKFEKSMERELIKQFSSNDEKPTLGDILEQIEE